MPAQTPLGIPYPLGTDRVADGDNAIQAVATYLDSSLTWGAAYVNGGGAGVNQQWWHTNCASLGASPGVTIDGNGIVVPRKGYYHVSAYGDIVFTQQLATSAGLFIGDGSTIWAQGYVYQDAGTAYPPTYNRTASCFTVVLLNAGARVRWGIGTAGATSAGIPSAGTVNNALLVRLLHAVA